MDNIFCKLFTVVHELQSYQVLAKTDEDSQGVPCLRISTQISNVEIAISISPKNKSHEEAIDRAQESFENFDIEQAEKHFLSMFKAFSEEE